MKRHIVFFACAVLLCFTVVALGQDTKKNEEKKEPAGEVMCAESLSEDALKSTPESKYVPITKYDPTRNADKDIKDALAEAKRTNKRVLLEVGGLWCIWCTHMDDFFDKQPEVLEFREKYFVTVKINFSDENKNEAVLSRYPNVAGYPHIFVLSSNGALFHSQDTGDLEEGKGYNVDKFYSFLKHWAAAPPETSRN